MYQCNTCNKKIENRRISGHRNGHIRRGEAEKKSEERLFVCKHCDLNFENWLLLRSHSRCMHADFDSIKSNGARKNRLLLERGEEGRRCEVCKLQTWCEKPIPLELDHIDGNPENNVRENLRIICPNCHAQTETYKGRNIGKVKNSKRQNTMAKYIGKYR